MSSSQAAFTEIPSVDMASLSDEALAAQLNDVCHRVGFFYLRNHGVDPQLMRDVLSLTRQFYAQPQSEKNKLAITFSPQFRGYGQLNAEKTHGVADFKETFDLGLERALVDVRAPYQVLQGPNQWPDVPKFKDTMIDYMQHMQALGFKLLNILVKSIGLDEDVLTKFDPQSKDAYAMLRLLHYPPAAPSQLGVGPHTDAGCLIFLLQDSNGGLQVQNHQGKWVSAPPMQDALIVNIGEMLQLLSGNYFQATLHRVINVSGRDRVSAPFFFEPRLSAKISSGGDATIYGEKMLDVFKRSFPQ